MQLVDDNVDDSTANNSIDAHSENVEPSNHESFNKANGPFVSPVKHLLNDSFVELQITLFMRENLNNLMEH